MPRDDDLRPHLRAVPGAAPVLDALAGEAGVHVVGGALRDALLGAAPRELDLVAEGDAVAVARRAAERLGGDVVVHDRFGTATVAAPGLSFDLAGARRERYPRPGALPEVELGATIQEDLARRDFTVNAIALRLADGSIVAFPGAREDLEARVLRVLHDRSFLDDPTRLLRLARYAARLAFDVEPATRALAADAVDAVDTVSPTRLGAELRLLGREPQPAAVLKLDELDLGRPVLHPAFAVDAALVGRALALCPDDGRPDLVALAACCLDAPDLAPRLDALAFPARERDTIAQAAGSAGRLAGELQSTQRPSRLWQLLRRKDPETVALAGALDGAAAARRWLDELRHVRPAIDGDDLVAAGISGPAVGRGLEAALAAALDGEAPDRETQLEVALRAAS